MSVLSSFLILKFLSEVPKNDFLKGFIRGVFIDFIRGVFIVEHFGHFKSDFCLREVWRLSIRIFSVNEFSKCFFFTRQSSFSQTTFEKTFSMLFGKPIVKVLLSPQFIVVISFLSNSTILKKWSIRIKWTIWENDGFLPHKIEFSSPHLHFVSFSFRFEKIMAAFFYIGCPPQLFWKYSTIIQRVWYALFRWVTKTAA